ncbi:helix-turn-helix domain-containing protein (plasmid) [Coraliomargarita sp. W4R53]
MQTQLLTKNAVLVDDQVRDEAQAVVEEMHDRQITGAKIVLDDGQEIELPVELAGAIQFVIAGLTQGDLSIRSVPDELTTTTAATLLGVSRPTLMKLVDDGTLVAQKVGTHHRFAYSDVSRILEKRRAAQQIAFDALRAFDEEHGFDD